MRKPKIIKVENPVGIHVPIQDLQSILGNITDEQGNLYFKDGHVFGLAEHDETTNEPILYSDKNDYFKTISADYLKSMCFFYESAPRLTSLSHTTYSIDLIVWYNEKVTGLRKANNDNRIQEWFIGAVQNAIRSYIEEEDTLSVITTPSDVFSAFTIQQDNPVFKSPNDGFRMSFTITDLNNC